MSNTRKIVPPLPHDLRKSHLSQSRPVHIASGDIEGPSINSHFDAASEAPSEIHSVVVVNDIGEMNVSRESFNEKELLNDDTNFQTLSISFYERKGQNIPHNRSLAAKNSLLAAIISPRNIYPAKKVEKPKEVLRDKTENINLHVPYFSKPLSSKASMNQSILDKSSSLFSIMERGQSPSTKMLISSARAHHEEGGAKVLKPPVSHRGPVNNENKKEISLIKEAEDYLVNRLEKKVKAQNIQNKENSKVLKFKGDNKKNLRLDLISEKVEALQPSEKASLNSERTVFNPERQQDIGVKKIGFETDRARLKTDRSVEREKPMSKLRESSSKNNRSMLNHANKIQSPRANVSYVNTKVPKLFVSDKSVSKIKRDNDTTQNTTQSQILSQNQSQNMNTSATEGVPRRFIELTKNIFSEISEQAPNRKEDFNKNSSAMKKETSRERSETRLRSSSKKATKKSMLNSLMNPGKIISGKAGEGSQKASPAKAKMQIVNRLPLHKLLNVAKSSDLRCVTSFRDSSCDNTQDQTELSAIMGVPKTATNKTSSGIRESLNGAKTTRNYQDDLTYGLGGFMSSRAVLGMNQNKEKSLNKNDTSFEFGFRPNTERGVLGKVNENRMSFDKRRGSKPSGMSLLKDQSQDESKIVNKSSSRVITAHGTEKKVQKNHNKENNHKVSFEHKHEKQNLNTSHGNGHVPGTCCKCGNPTKKNIQAQNAYYK